MVVDKRSIIKCSIITNDGRILRILDDTLLGIHVFTVFISNMC